MLVCLLFICTFDIRLSKKLNQTGAIKEKFSSREILDSKFNKMLYSGITMVF